MIRVPSLTPQQLEDRAYRLLTDYEKTIGANVPTPIPVVDIAQDELALDLECIDLHARLRIPRKSNSADILGCMLFDERKIQIDESLNPEQYPHQIGRYRFSLGHEIGHWVLHRAVIFKKQALTSKPIIVCRDMGSTTALPAVEFQAESFSSFLLLPRERVLDAWGDQPQFSFSVDSHGSKDLRRLWWDPKQDEAAARAMYQMECDRMFDNFAAPLAKVFQVSKQAMRLRLQGLGVLHRIRPRGSNRAA